MLSRLFIIGALGASALAGCGDWVEYEGTRPAAEAPPPEQVVDESFEDAYSEATRLDHLLFESVLTRHVTASEDGQYTFVDYDGIRASEEATFLLDQYVATLDIVDPAKLESFEERFAFWINAYNALVLKGVLDIYEGDASYSVSDELFAFFSKRSFRAAGLVLSLDELEHVIVRGDREHSSAEALTADELSTMLALHDQLWDGRALDPRLHVAVNCASLGCPNLAPTAFRAADLEAQLAERTRSFLASPEKGAGPDGVSSLFNWFAKDFSEGDYEGPEDFIERWREGGAEGVRVDRFLDYDWSLNIVP